MEAKSASCFLILFVFLFCGGCNGQLCNNGNKTFVCLSSTTFLQCINFNGILLTSPTDVRTCFPNTFCNNLDAFECSSDVVPGNVTLTPVPVTTASSAVTTTAANPSVTSTPNTAVTTTRNTATANTTTVTTQAPPACTRVGKMPDPTVPNCKGYITCSRRGNTYVQVKSTCAGLTVYDPVQTVCSDRYQCSSFTSCVKVGREINTNDPTCKTYYLCVRNREGGFSRGIYKCPGNTVYNYRINCCVSNYVCSFPTVTPAPTLPPVVRCPRFSSRRVAIADPTVANCRGYIICEPRNNVYQMYRYNCVLRNVFNPNIRQCVPQNMYTCPNNLSG